VCVTPTIKKVYNFYKLNQILKVHRNISRTKISRIHKDAYSLKIVIDLSHSVIHNYTHKHIYASTNT